MTIARTTRLVAVPIAALLALTLGGCSAITDLLGGQNVTRDSDTQEVTEAGDADVFSLQRGDCFNDESASEVSEVPAVLTTRSTSSSICPRGNIPARTR